MLREVGRFSSASLLKLVLTAVVRTSTTGDCPVTVTVSATPPTLNRTSIVATKPTSRRTASRRTDWNPLSSKVTVNAPAGSAANR